MKVLLLFNVAATALAFAPSTPSSRSATSLSAELSRVEFASTIASAGAALMLGAPPALAADTVTLPSGVTYTVTNAGDGPSPDVGQMAAIRFIAKCVDNGNTIDDITNTPEPYYTRVGSGGLIKVSEMRIGQLTFFHEMIIPHNHLNHYRI